MYRKIGCKNGTVILYSDLEEKKLEINNLNLIRVAEIDNLLEQINAEEEIVRDTIEKRKLTNKKKKLRSLGLVLFVILVSFVPFITNIINTLTIYIPLFNVFIFTLSMLISLIVFQNVMFSIPYNKKDILSNKKVLEFLNQKFVDLKEEKEKLLKIPCFDTIRDHQEFTIKDGKSIRTTIEYLNSLYKYEKKVANIFDENVTIDEIKKKTFRGFNDGKVDYDSREDIVNEIYKIIRKRKVLMKKTKYKEL